jgi:hypothetical protein
MEISECKKLGEILHFIFHTFPVLLLRLTVEVPKIVWRFSITFPTTSEVRESKCSTVKRILNINGVTVLQ